jgi:hypothetical protein
MTDHEIVDNINRSLSETGSALEELSRGADTSVFSNNIGNTMLGLLFCLTILGICFYMSHNFQVVEREELAEAERNRIEAEKKEIQKLKTYRSKMAKIIESYAIHLTNMTSSVSMSVAGAFDKSSSNNSRQIPGGNEDDGVPIGMITITSKSSSSSTEDIEESRDDFNIDDDDDSISGAACETACETIRSTLTIDIRDQSTQDEDQDHPLPSSSSSIATTGTLTRANLREAVTGNPCAICLEPFKPGDDIVCCSNNVNGKKPHIFHQSCSLDYIVTHIEGIHAPCPCCRRLLLPTDEQRKGCLKHSHSSALTLPELGDGLEGF